MEAILSGVSSIFTSAIGMVATVGTTVAEEPLLLLYAVLPICGIGIGFFKRLINVN